MWGVRTGRDSSEGRQGSGGRVKRVRVGRLSSVDTFKNIFVFFEHVSGNHFRGEVGRQG